MATKNVNGVEIEMTAEEVTAHEAAQASVQADNEARKAEEDAKADLKASAKAKLIAGEALTEDEANTIVL
jgi:hypothetical protein